MSGLPSDHIFARRSEEALVNPAMSRGRTSRSNIALRKIAVIDSHG
jgi:hypothetical protein